MSKAYNWVDWGSIEALLIKIGFSFGWVDRIRRFVSTVNYSMVVNGIFGD